MSGVRWGADGAGGVAGRLERRQRRRKWIIAALCCRDGMRWAGSSRRSRFISFFCGVNQLIAIERITLGSALVFKDVRLRALQEAPTAFSSTYAKESAFLDEEWKKRCDAMEQRRVGRISCV